MCLEQKEFVAEWLFSKQQMIPEYKSREGEIITVIETGLCSMDVVEVLTCKESQRN